MVDPSRRAESRSNKWPTTWCTRVFGSLSCAVIVISASLSANAQGAAPGAAEPARQERITRLQDSLDAGEDWDIGVPVMESDSSFEGAIRAGRALRSEAYLELDRELRQVQQMLQARPDDEAAQRRLADVRGALAERIEVNINFDYLYAAAVYIELFRQAEGSPSAVRQFSQRLRERRSRQPSSG